MRILLIMPDAHMHKLRLGPYLRSMREAPLTLTTLAALVPDDPEIEVKIVDGSVDRIPLDDPADLVGISVITGCAPSAYAIARHYRLRGTPVVLGGVHVSVLPGEEMCIRDSQIDRRVEDALVVVIESEDKAALNRDAATVQHVHEVFVSVSYTHLDVYKRQTQHVMEMFRRSLPIGNERSRLDLSLIHI